MNSAFRLATSALLVASTSAATDILAQPLPDTTNTDDSDEDDRDPNGVDTSDSTDGEEDIALGNTVDTRSAASDHAIQSFQAGLPCWKAIETSPSKARIDKDDIEKYYLDNDFDAVCIPPWGYLRSHLDISIWKSRSNGALPWSNGRYQAIQIVPTVTIGGPALTMRMEPNALAKAMKGASVFAGASLRYTPSSYIYSFNLNYGASDATGELDPAVYPAPKVVVMGLGLTFFGVLDISFMNARLKRDGYWDETVDSGYYLGIAADLSTIILLPASLQK